MVMEMLYIYNNLKYIRKQLKLSQNAFAEKLNINVSNISRWENSKNGMSLDTAYNISEKLGVSLPDLVGKDLSTEELNFNKIINSINK
ncbi:MAG TPA: helix-turn-helix domain-containing protein [Candidatus Coprosoma intestinipullorum]|uniref:Helix-turn-helix domain-containing protein n=1 Tax=Candidatus Coprosoma intestinipullorum TaxID=2840752 RepID=A0A9D0ZR95_9FIRM|nr:helix-turn-helix domain-containing protein [Candidatus Coprosoma intestinipullorum]